MDNEYRQVLNSHKGLSNIIEGDNIKLGMIKVATRIKNILQDHCGPYGKFATVCDPNPIIKPTFTKDGIDIVTDIELVSPLEKHMKDQLHYIGKKIEKAAGDGTTSSMIMAATLLEDLIEHRFTGVAYNDFVVDYNLFISNVEKILNELVVKADSKDNDMVRKVAFTQAMTSSHGNKELSNLIADTFATTPPKSWNSLRYVRSQYENSPNFDVSVIDADYHCRASPHNNRMVNNERGDELNHDDCDILFSTTGLVAHSVDYDIITTRINKCLDDPESKPLVIIIPQVSDAITRGEIDTILHQKDHHRKIGIFSVRTSDNVRINDMVAMASVFRVPYCDLTDNPLTLHNAKFSYKFGELQVSNVIERTPDLIHPDVEDEESPVYAFLRILDQAVDDVHNGLASNDFAAKISNYHRIRNAVTLQVVKEITVGGTNYDNAASMPVVDDSIKAAREALREGIVLGSYETLREALETYDDYEDKLKLEAPEALDSFIEYFLSAINEVAEGLYRYSGKDLKDAVTKPGVGRDVKTGETYTLDDVGKDKVMITQPLSVDLTLMKRFGEVGLKFIFTNRTIIPNGVCMDEETLNK